jgi:hypothetical protein
MPTKNKKLIVIDIDGTICAQTDGDYENAQPFLNRIREINKLYDDGNTIVYYTARGMRRCKGDIDLVYENFYELTKNQLNKWGARHHNLVLGKMPYDHFICDKAINANDYFASCDWRDTVKE